ncbi:MAG: insulinase family protein [Phenylobacterium sp.]|uniref:M16 family metallopeptidase n=1 Tax=Phenylobacterium sp. TaxID=1871053 RepID=UPI00273293C3|nr:insulinase family protein [Phenylobacterium sp.]MDP1640822.1 insulinase family protein [Phenylobacterium sp.]MDP3118084.1 insulinase family protein [Phenylobacterium sp.]
MRSFWAACVLAGCLALAGLPGARADEPAEVHPDLVTGELSNGLEYQILPLVGREGVAFRLLVWVGSQAETDDNRGIAHFVEHMAFRTTRRFADGEMDQAMAKAGAAFGRDHAAYTGRWTTTYHLDLPSRDPGPIATGLEWLRDVGDGLSFLPAEVAAERGVVLAERLDRTWTGQAVEEQETAFHFRPEDSLSPGGAVATLRAMTPADLKAFHARWYRPDRALLVVTGDVEPRAMVAELERRLGGWAGAGERPRMADTPDPEPPEAPVALILPPTRLPAQSLACRNAPVPEAGAGGLEEDILLEVLSRRLARAAATARGVYSLEFDTTGRYETRQVACLMASHGPQMGLDALNLGQGELRAFAVHGPEQGEIDAAVAEQRAKARGALTERANATAAETADELVYSIAGGGTFLHPHQMMRQVSRGAPGLTPDRLRQTFAALWPADAPPTLSVEEAGATAEAVVSGWRAAAAGPLPRPTPAPRPIDLDLGPPGKVIKREALAQGATRLTFANGLVLNHLASDRSPGSVEIIIRQGPGARQLNAGDFVTASVAVSILPYAGIEAASYTALQELNAQWSWDFDVRFGEYGLAVTARSFADQVAPHLTLITAHLATPGFSDETADQLALLAAHMEQEIQLNPAEAAANAFARTIWPDTAGAARDPDTYRRTTPDDLRRVMATQLAAGPVELTLVGDISETAAIAAAATTLGARPLRPPLAPTPERPPLDYARAPDGPIEVKHQGSAERSAARIYWTRPPLEGEKTQAAALVLSELMELAVTDETRRKRGQTYSPVVDLDGDLDDPHDIAIYVEVTPDAASLDAVTDAVRQTAQSFIEAPPNPAAIDQVVRPLLAQLKTAQLTDSYWAMALGSPFGWDAARKAVDDLGAALAEVTPADVHALAVPWLSAPPILVLARPAAPLRDAQ